MQLNETEVGSTKDGRPVQAFTMTASDGASVTVMTYGATLTSVVVPDKNGRPGEVTLAFDNLESYLRGHPYFGSTVGRYANRINNPTFHLSGTTYSLPRNDGRHHLHGGPKGFDKQLWAARAHSGISGASVAFTRTSGDGEEGYPGELTVHTTYRFTDAHELSIEYCAATDKPTVINMTNHAYWNLSAPGATVLDHLLMLNCDRYLPTDDELVVAGTVEETAGTPRDFRTQKPIGLDIEKAGGYDDCFIINGEAGRMRRAAALFAPDTGRIMTVDTTQRAVQVYTSNMLEDTPGRNGALYSKHGAVCLETGAYDDAVNHHGFPSTLLEPGRLYNEVTLTTFGTRN